LEATLEHLAALTGAVVRGDAGTAVVGIAGIQHARPGEIALLSGDRFRKFLATTAASALVVAEDFDPSQTEIPLLVTAEPEAAFETIAAHFVPDEAPPEPGVHPSAIVADDAAIDPTASVGASCVVDSGAVIGARTVLRAMVYIGRNAQVGSDGMLYPNSVVLDRCVLGDRVILHSGVVIGADGYGFDTRDGVHHKIPQRGIVEIGDDVEVGANTTIDRARYGRTVIGAGTKIDNLVQVAHNVVVGEHSLLVAQAGIAGSVTLGHHVVVAAQAGLVGHIQIGDGATIGAKAGVPGDLEAGAVVLGAPCQDIRQERRCMIAYKRLPETDRRVRELERAIEKLTEKVVHLEAQAKDDTDAD
jgi:UDP-3-O-[3-hydroxymyristoyl] glucosamine N-acyltransferase